MFGIICSEDIHYDSHNWFTNKYISMRFKQYSVLDHELNARDGDMCVICGIDKVENAHVIDKHRAELLVGAPNAPDIDDIRNLFHLCPKHHVSFDRFEWTLVTVE